MRPIFPLLLARLVLSLLLIGLPVRIFSSSQGTSSISGTVSGRDDQPLENLQLLLYPGSGQGYPADTFYTSSAGKFGFTLADDRSYILEIKGDQGAGRVYIPSGEGKPNAKNLEITYPVRETIVILHTNDLHFTLNKTEELAGAIASIRQKYDDVFLFDAGDIFVRHPMRWIVNGRLMRDPVWYGERALLMVSTMNDLGYDLMTPGNHDLAYHEPHTRIALEAATFPLLAANMEITTAALPNFDDFAMLNTSTGRKVAVLGLTTGNAEGVREMGVRETVHRHLYLVDSSDVFMALSHLGLRRDRLLAEDFPQFDVIIGGHSHDLLREGLTVNSVLIAQAGGNPHFVSDSHPVFLGKVVIVLENGKIAEKYGRVIEIKDQDQPAGKSEYYFEEAGSELRQRGY
jgi:2',3'-cyclic-nucleotide 2'-phosphodiesterase (5'-nucleotidase family)